MRSGQHGWTRARRRGALVGRAALALAVAAAGALTGPPASAATSLAIDTGGTNGVGRITLPGRSCADGGTGGSWHYGYRAALPGGVFSKLPTDLRMNLDVRRDGDLGTEPATPTGWLQGTESTVALVNERGALILRLADGGGCDSRTAVVTRRSVVTSGTWTVEQGSGSYAGATGSGVFTVDAGIAPGADNPWSLNLGGDVAVVQPDLRVSVVRTFWGNLGLDYLSRRPSVVLRVTNEGGGDAFGAVLTDAQSPTNGAALLAGPPVDLGDLAPGESVDVVLLYQLGLLRPCTLVILGCTFGITARTTASDALDEPIASAQTVPATAPLLPPPL